MRRQMVQILKESYNCRREGVGGGGETAEEKKQRNGKKMSSPIFVFLVFLLLCSLQNVPPHKYEEFHNETISN